MRHPVDCAPSQNFGDNPTSKIRPGSADYWIVERFGNYQPDGHTGTDYPCPAGTPVRAAADGTVLHVGRLSGTYADNPWWISPDFAGYVAVIDHGHFIGIYGHCQTGSSRVRVGQRVAEGDVFILSGNTGASTGDHLHFECLPDGYVLNSYMYGRINPATLFGGITLQSSIITLTEDDMANWSDEDKANHFKALTRIDNGVAALVATNVGALPDKQYWDDNIKAVGRIDGGVDNLVQRPPADIAAQINAAGIAAEVQAELVKLIGGK